MASREIRPRAWFVRWVARYVKRMSPVARRSRRSPTLLGALEPLAKVLDRDDKREYAYKDPVGEIHTASVTVIESADPQAVNVEGSIRYDKRRGFGRVRYCQVP